MVLVVYKANAFTNNSGQWSYLLEENDATGFPYFYDLQFPRMLT